MDIYSAETVSGWVNADFLQPGDAKVNPPSPTPHALKSPPISEAEDRAKYWETRGYHFNPDLYTAYTMDQKVVDIDRAKYWEARGYHFNPDLYTAYTMDLEVGRMKRSQH